jgi:hypothetical protein
MKMAKQNGLALVIGLALSAALPGFGYATT